MTTFLRRVFEVSADSAELLIAALADAGTLGVEERAGDDGSHRFVAYFSAGAAAPAGLPSDARLVAEASIPATDWLAGYRAAAQPLNVGDRFVIDPREPTPRGLPHPDEERADLPPGRILLRVPARSAFGTGSHASTRLALRLLERQPLAGRGVLDVGTGSGVLALAALALGARRADGFDLDVAAALLAGQHARLNQLAAAFWAGGSGALSPPARYDLVVVNALPHEVLPEAERLAAAVAGDGVLVVSGVLATEGEATLEAWSRHGLTPIDTLAEEEWVAWTLARQ